MKKIEENNIVKIYSPISSILREARKNVVKSINFTMVQAYWNIGKIIFEDEQSGKERAEYGKYLLKELSIKLTNEFGKGFDETNLKNMRRFYKTFPNINENLFEIKFPPIGDAVSPQSKKDQKGDAVRSQLSTEKRSPNNQNSSVQPTFRKELTWTHYRLLLKVKSDNARFWYMSEAADNAWSTRVLDRQINSFYFERLLKSKNKNDVKTEVEKSIKQVAQENILKDPYILEFLDLKDKDAYRESDFEQELINKLHEFLLELGKGFSFIARQKRIKTDDEDFYVDLVFYNYILKCFVLIDLKIGKLTPQDIGQMDMYVRLYEDKFKTDGDNPTIGIILCSDKNETVVKYSVLSESKQIFASKYQLYLPTEEELVEEINREINVIKEQNIVYKSANR